MNKHYAFTDIHGDYELWTSIKNYCDDTDVIIFLGDACDRGKDGIKIMQELLADKRVIYLMGNHELMFLKGIKDYFNQDGETFFYNYHLWISNGGSPTIEQFLSLNKEEQNNLYYSIKNLGICCSYQNKFLCHSGCSFKDLLTKDKKEIDFLWNRQHFEEDISNLFTDKIIIHGHTPVQYFNNNTQEIYRYCNGKKIDIDMGAFFSKVVALLDLDSLIPIYFSKK